MNSKIKNKTITPKALQQYQQQLQQLQQRIEELSFINIRREIFTFKRLNHNPDISSNSCTGIRLKNLTETQTTVATIIAELAEIGTLYDSKRCQQH
ncbi:unnamed protein product [Ceratitis capitata]|uniref:(Mediterranean fruit fly) hypothetical protein n=1 Tax=Ceratitis capitata TaxID=7213 RepID=A0A811VHY9_CERCA|nr:unnamed protein product [Ceratitis capitata]